MGHSTGCQDVMHYLTSAHQENSQGAKRPQIDAGILQSPVSDREAIVMTLSPEDYNSSCGLARTMVDSGHGADVLPKNVTKKFFPAPISATRWLSLASPGPDHVGDDDYFSSDFDDERLRGTFGKIGASGAVLGIYYGGEDQYVPGFVDKEKLVGRWMRIIEEGEGVVGEGSGIIPGATHNVQEGGKPLEDLISRVGRLVKQVEKQSSNVH